MRVLQSVENPRHHGPITCLCLDRKRSWIVVATATGVLSLWDLRFGLLLKNWKVGRSNADTRIYACHIHPTKGRGKWIVVALETAQHEDQALTTLIEVWDIEKTSLVERFGMQSTASVAQDTTPPAAAPKDADVDAEANPAAALAALVRSRQQQHMPGSFTAYAVPGVRDDAALPADVRAMVVGVDFGGHAAHKAELGDLAADAGPRARTPRGFVLTGSEDRRVRFWDLGKIERSGVLSGLESEVDRPTYRCEGVLLIRPVWLMRLISVTTAAGSNVADHVETWQTPPGGQSNRPPQRMSLINTSQQTLLKAHQDTVTALACIDSPFRGGIVSGDRSGVIKVWRVDALD